MNERMNEWMNEGMRWRMKDKIQWGLVDKIILIYRDDKEAKHTFIFVGSRKIYTGHARDQLLNMFIHHTV